MRRSEILSLTWDKVDLKERMIRLESADTKEGLSKKVPISKTLKIILESDCYSYCCGGNDLAVLFSPALG